MNFTKNLTGVTNLEIETFLESLDETRFSASVLGGSLDGTGDTLTAPDSADWDFSDGDFTIEVV